MECDEVGYSITEYSLASFLIHRIYESICNSSAVLILSSDVQMLLDCVMVRLFSEVRPRYLTSRNNAFRQI